MQAVSQSTQSKKSGLNSAVYTMAETASLFGMGYTTLWTQLQEGIFPITPIKIGRHYKFPKATVDRLLGLDALIEQDVA